MYDGIYWQQLSITQTTSKIELHASIFHPIPFFRCCEFFLFNRSPCLNENGSLHGYVCILYIPRISTMLKHKIFFCSFVLSFSCSLELFNSHEIANFTLITVEVDWLISAFYWGCQKNIYFFKYTIFYEENL